MCERHSCVCVTNVCVSLMCVCHLTYSRRWHDSWVRADMPACSSAMAAPSLPYVALLQKYRALLLKYRALLQWKYRAFLQMYSWSAITAYPLRIHLQKALHFQCKRTYISTKEPCTSTKEPNFYNKRALYFRKKTYISTKKPCISTKEPNIVLQMARDQSHRTVTRHLQHDDGLFCGNIRLFCGK